MSFDRAVIGGGILGCAAAYWLKRLEPQANVVLLEAETLASGATGRNAGFLLQGVAPDYATDYDTLGAEAARRLWRFTRENRILMETELAADAFDLEASGSLLAAGSEEEGHRLRRSAQLLREDGVAATYLDAGRANRRLASSGFRGALLVPTGGMLHPVKLVRHLAAESEATVLEHHEVLDISEDRGRITMETPQRQVRCDQLLVCAGAGISKLHPELEPFARPVRAQMLSTEAAPNRWLDVPVYSHAGYFYVRQVKSGQVLVGGARHLHRDEEAGHGDETTPALQEDLEAYLNEHFPRARGLRIANRWTGTMSFSPDRLPVVGRLPSIPRGWWAAGCTGHGLAYGFRFGRLLAERLLDRHRPELFQHFSAARFDGEAAAPDRR